MNIPSLRTSVARSGRTTVAGALALAAIGFCRPAAAVDALTASAGPSLSQYAPQSVYGELELIGAALDFRVRLPYHLYGQVEVRSEDGTGSFLGPSAAVDYFRLLAEAGFEVRLPFRFIGNAGLNYVQSDVDLGGAFDDPNFTVGLNREGIGGRVGLARKFGSWLAVRAEMEYSPVERAIAGIFDVEPVRFGPWGVALQYNKYPFLTQAAVLLRYHFEGEPDPAEPEPEEPRPPASIPDHLAPGGRVLQLQTEFLEPPPERPLFVPPPGCEPNDFEVLSPRCDPPYVPAVPGEPEWKYHPMPE